MSPSGPSFIHSTITVMVPVAFLLTASWAVNRLGIGTPDRRPIGTPG